MKKKNFWGRSINSQKGHHTETSSKSILRMVEQQNRGLQYANLKLEFFRKSRIYNVEEFPSTFMYMNQLI